MPFSPLCLFSRWTDGPEEKAKRIVEEAKKAHPHPQLMSADRDHKIRKKRETMIASGLMDLGYSEYHVLEAIKRGSGCVQWLVSHPDEVPRLYEDLCSLCCRQYGLPVDIVELIVEFTLSPLPRPSK